MVDDSSAEAQQTDEEPDHLADLRRQLAESNALLVDASQQLVRLRELKAEPLGCAGGGDAKGPAGNKPTSTYNHSGSNGLKGLKKRKGEHQAELALGLLPLLKPYKKTK